MSDHDELVLLARRGDREAFDELVRSFQDRVVGYAYSVLGDFGLAEDAAQDAFIDAYENLAQLRDPAAFPRWLRRIAMARCGRITRGKRVPTVPLDGARDVASPQAGPPEAAETAETRRAVMGAIRGLPERERAVVTLFYVNEHSHREIGEFLDVPVSTVKSRLHSARRRMKARLIGMVKDDLQAQRPSRSDEFVEGVKKGLRGVYVDETRTSHIDGEAATLQYRGYDIDDLARQASFEETAYLLLRGRSGLLVGPAWRNVCPDTGRLCRSSDKRPC